MAYYLSWLHGASGTARTWSQVTGNEGYRVIWDSSTHATATGSIEEIEALYPNSADTATDVNSYTISGTGTKYWRVSALVNGSAGKNAGNDGKDVGTRYYGVGKPTGLN